MRNVYLLVKIAPSTPGIHCNAADTISEHLLQSKDLRALVEMFSSNKKKVFSKVTVKSICLQRYYSEKNVMSFLKPSSVLYIFQNVRLLFILTEMKINYKL